MADADPNQVGKPGKAAAIIDYPAHKPNDYHIPYNYKDVVNVEWFSYAANDSETTMQIWYWTSNMNTNDKYKPLTKYVVPVNGTLSFNLDDVPKIDGGYYLGQWNLNFTRQDKTPVTGLTLSQPFNCSFDDTKAATTYSPQGAATGGPTGTPSSSSASQSSSTRPTSKSNSNSNSASSVVSSSSTAGPTSGVLNAASGAMASPSVTATASPGLSGGAIAGIVIAILAALALGALGAYFVLRRKRMQKNTSSYPPPAYNQQYPGADPYKQQMAGYPTPGAAMQAPMAAYVPPGAKSQYVAQQQEQYFQQQAAYEQQQREQMQHQMQMQAQMHQQQQQMGAYGQPQAGGFVSELPSAHNQGGFDGVPAQQAERGAQSFRQELPAERYS